MRFLNKRGISPLIATVLLIGFTVALAAVVITWGSGFVNKVTSTTEESTLKTISCTTDVSFEITKVTCDTEPGNPDPSTITVDNRGSLDIEGLILRFYDINGEVSGEATNTEPIGKFEVKTILLYPDTIPQEKIPTETTKVEAIAVVKYNDQNLTCGGNARQKSFTPSC